MPSKENTQFSSAYEIQRFFEGLKIVKERDVKRPAPSSFDAFYSFLKSQKLNTRASLRTFVQQSMLQDQGLFQGAYGQFQERYQPLKVDVLLYLMDKALLNSRIMEYEVCYPDVGTKDKVKILLMAILWSEYIFPCHGGEAWKRLFIRFRPETIREILPGLSTVKWTPLLEGGDIMEEDEESTKRDFEIIDRLWDWFCHDEQGPSVKLVFHMALWRMESDAWQRGVAPIIDDIKRVLLQNDRMGGQLTRGHAQNAILQL
ncbi:RelA/SpoT [Penicillium malachiteum]|nr:RelA/SpoT [Penicillium malachiteum]